MGRHGYAAAWVKAFERDELDTDHNDDPLRQDDWESVMVGARYDWDPPTPDAASLQFGWRQYEAEDGFAVSHFVPPYRELVRYRRLGALFHALGRFSHRFSERSEGSVRAYYDRNHSDFGNADLRHETLDVDSQVRFPLGGRHDVVCGAGYRRIMDKLRTPADIGTTFFDPEEANLDLFTLFVDDEIAFMGDRLSLKLGCKLEHNEYTGWETQPNARLLARLTPRQVVWAAVSRAVRTPSRLDMDSSGGFSLPPSPATAGLPLRFEIEEGDPDSEKLVACELGYRMSPHPSMWVDTALFYNDYEDLRSYAALTDGFVPAADPPRLEQRLQLNDGKEGRSYGAELASSWQVSAAWSLVGTYSLLFLDMQLDERSIDIPGITDVEGRSPRHQVGVRSRWDVNEDLECDVWLRYVDDLPQEDVEAYGTVDVRVAWRPRWDLEISVTGRSLAEEWHGEFGSYEVERSVHGKVTYVF